MNKDIAEKWVAALRSGKYKQGRGFLQKKNITDGCEVYCCLGVLCAIYAQETGRPGLTYVQSENRASRGRSNVACFYDDCDELLPADVRDWAELKTSSGAYGPDRCGPHGSQHTLVDHNDYCVPFVEIADIIEKHWEEL